MIQTILNIDFKEIDKHLDSYIKANLIFADPPYGVTNLSYDKKKFDLEAFWRFCQDRLESDGVVVVTAVIKFAIHVINMAPKGWFRYDLVWEKTTPTGHLNAKRQPLRNHELILVFSPSAKHTYNPQMTHGHERKVSLAKHKDKCLDSGIYGKAKHTDYDSTDRYPKSVQVFKSDKQKSNLHPNQKPVELLRWIVRTYSNDGELVMDPTAGSGTTGVAALAEGRQYVMLEVDGEYYNKMQNRIEEYGKGR